MNERLSTLQVVALLSYAVGMAAGQVLFKLAARQMTPDGGLFERVLSLSLSPYFLSALVLYLVLSGIWVWILSFTAISQAYLFAILSVYAALALSEANPRVTFAMRRPPVAYQSHLPPAGALARSRSLSPACSTPAPTRAEAVWAFRSCGT